MGWFLLIVLAGVVLYVVSIYNRLIRYRVESENSWSQIDVQLKRRHDLIPNLVETVKGYMQYELDTLTKVMEARAKAVGSGDMQSKIKAEGEISGLLGRLMAVWENYPDLKANKNAMHLQEELTTTENRIGYARGHYNDIVANYNALLEQFPSNQVAKMFGPFQKKIFFEMPEIQKEAPKVKF